MSDNATTNDPDRPHASAEPAGAPEPAVAGRERRPTGGIQPDSKTKPLIDLTTGTKPGWLQRRREKMVAEVQRNRRGDYTVPTWVLLLTLVVIVAAWAALIIFG